MAKKQSPKATPEREKCVSQINGNKKTLANLLFIMEDYLGMLTDEYSDIDSYYFTVCPLLDYQKDNIYYSDGAVSLEVCLITKNEVRGLLRIVYSKIRNGFCISNICLPEFLKHKGIGLYLIEICYKVTRYYDYQLYLVQMVDSFFNRMLRRGAAQSGIDEVVINENTDLTIHKQ